MKKRITAALLAAGLLLSLTAIGAAEATTFTATAQGFGGDVTAVVTLEDLRITACELTGEQETAEIGGKALPELEAQVVKAGSAEIDGVSGATLTSNAVKAAVRDCLDQANGVEKSTTAVYKAGTYEGTGRGMMGEIRVKVTVDETSIRQVEVVSQNDTEMIGWGLETAPVELLSRQIVEYQSLNLDAVTGATVTSNGVKAAVANALEASGVDVSLLQNGPKAVSGSVDEELTCDVVVAGAGAAGLMAAVEAAYNGANVIVVEKAGVLTGSATRNGGLLMASGTPYTDVDNEALIDFLYAEIGNKNVDEERIRGFVEGSADMLAFFESLGTVIENVQNICDGVVELPVVYNAAKENPDGVVDLKPWTISIGSLYMAPLYEKAVELGVEFRFNTPMTSLTTDDEGGVNGILCERKDGTRVVIQADATILATGGFAGDPARILANKTMKEGQFYYVGANTNTGEGMMAAQAVGAAVRYEDDMPFLATLQNKYTSTKFRSLMITPEGEHFTKEYDYHNAVSADLNRAGWCYAYEIIDESFGDDSSYAAAIAAAADGSAGGAVIVASSVQELAEKLGMDAAVLGQTLERYNEMCAKGVDEDYGKIAEYLKPIATDGSRTLYALKDTENVTDSFGGIKTDPTAHVLSENGERIPGLYAAGAVAFTDWIDVEYPGCGYGFGTALYMGRMAGTHAASDLGMEGKDILLDK